MKNKGITLIALIITIVVLIILAGVSISTIMGQGNIKKNAIAAKDLYNRQAKLESVQIAAMNASMTGNLEVDEQTLKDGLNASFGEDGYDIEGNTEDGWTVTIGDDKFTISTSGDAKLVGNNTGNGGNGENGDNTGEGNNEGTGGGDNTGGSGDNNGGGNNGPQQGYAIASKVKVGDYVNYSVGNWTDADIKKLKDVDMYIPLSNFESAEGYKFKGFGTQAMVENYSVGVYNKDGNVTNGTTVGWRVLSINEETGTVDIIHAGCPEKYRHPGATNSPYKSQYLLGGRNI